VSLPIDVQIYLPRATARPSLAAFASILRQFPDTCIGEKESLQEFIIEFPSVTLNMVSELSITMEQILQKKSSYRDSYHFDELFPRLAPDFKESGREKWNDIKWGKSCTYSFGRLVQLWAAWIKCIPYAL
jgi:hypothetical protein